MIFAFVILIMFLHFSHIFKGTFLIHLLIRTILLVVSIVLLQQYLFQKSEGSSCIIYHALCAKCNTINYTSYQQCTWIWINMNVSDIPTLFYFIWHTYVYRYTYSIHCCNSAMLFTVDKNMQIFIFWSIQWFIDYFTARIMHVRLRVNL